MKEKINSLLGTNLERLPHFPSDNIIAQNDNRKPSLPCEKTNYIILISLWIDMDKSTNSSCLSHLSLESKMDAWAKYAEILIYTSTDSIYAILGLI